MTEADQPTPQKSTQDNVEQADPQNPAGDAEETPRAEGVTAGDAESAKVTKAVPSDDATLVPGPTGQQSAHEGGTTDSGGVQQQG